MKVAGIVSIVVVSILVIIGIILGIVFGTRKTACACENGVCGSDPNTCQSCNTNFVLQNNKCVKCGCANGTCKQGDPTKCDTCNKGYVKDSTGKCVQQSCNCTFGTCATGSDTCDKCNAGYHLDDGECKEITSCICEADGKQVGDPMTGGDCTPDSNDPTKSTTPCCDTDKKNICFNCDQGEDQYILDDNHQCVDRCPAGMTYTDWPTQKGDPKDCALCPKHTYVQDSGTTPTSHDLANHPESYASYCDNYQTYFGGTAGTDAGKFSIVTNGTDVHTSGKTIVKNTSSEYANANSDISAWTSSRDVCPVGSCYAYSNDGSKVYCFHGCIPQNNDEDKDWYDEYEPLI